ncbi:MAG TPA: cyclic nucleotide-binding domain-containing protein [Thermomicrobiales bacterium]|nr:cyclic nucleotide-binding domain-containing protein [Thermomicrobiales bacterium]
MSEERVVSEAQLDKAALLRGVPLFAGLGEERRAALAALSRVCVFPEGAEIIEEDADVIEDEDGLYLLVDGTVEVRKGSTDGADGHLLASFGPGEFFGEMALLDNLPRSASVFATSDVQCLVLSRWDFLRQLRADPEVAIQMLAALAGRLRRTDERHAAQI